MGLIWLWKCEEKWGEAVSKGEWVVSRSHLVDATEAGELCRTYGARAWISTLPNPTGWVNVCRDYGAHEENEPPGVASLGKMGRQTPVAALADT